MSKCIYWLDDDTQKVTYVMQGIFPRLWALDKEEETSQIRSEIFIFGDAHKDNSGTYTRTKKDEIELQDKIDSLFFEQCVEHTKSDWDEANDLYVKKYSLIECTAHIVLTEWSPEDDVFITDTSEREREKKRRKEISEHYQTVYDYWEKEIKDLSGDPYEKAEKDLEWLINDVIKIPQDAGVGIDLVLLYGDKKRAADGYPILSMELYSKLKNRNCCFLYSTYEYDKSFVDQWKSTYQKKYGDSGEIVIYNRKMFLQKPGSVGTEAVEGIIERIK